ncbi:hypothetical protein OEZ85_000080 [Tetradesmus obliquus]|uniref:Fucosyltransferase n=1 Tax=Tetradesmus obliquus TaxID=3088 RepID=A0ABY8UUT9_TETOB|nr:hypothetical protein OEZ85_000080 [Tetradesmus obliquus]
MAQCASTQSSSAAAPTEYFLADLELLPQQESGVPYAVEELKDLDSLITAHSAYQTHGEVFHAVARHLFQPAAAVTAAMQPYLHQTHDCAVALHMRRKKSYEGQQVQAEHFADIARMLARSSIGSMFLASDADVVGRMQQLLGQQLWWSNLTSASVVTHNTTAGNPGTELSAFVDILLTICEAIVVSPASSFGCVAAGIAGVRPVYAAFGAHDAPFVNPWFWQSNTSEPCMYKAGKGHGFGGQMQARLRAGYALYLYQTQCHH